MTYSVVLAPEAADKIRGFTEPDIVAQVMAQLRRLGQNPRLAFEVKEGPL